MMDFNKQFDDLLAQLMGKFDALQKAATLKFRFMARQTGQFTRTRK